MYISLITHKFSPIIMVAKNNNIQHFVVVKAYEINLVLIKEDIIRLQLRSSGISIIYSIKFKEKTPIGLNPFCIFSLLKKI